MKRMILLLFISLLSLLCVSAYADTLTLPASLSVIEEEAFCGDTGIDRVVLRDGVTTIEARAFADSGLTSINLPASLTSIADDALPSPGSVTVTADVGTWAYGWAVEKGYIVPEASPLTDFVIENGVVTKYVGPGGDVVIPNKDKDGNDVVGIGNESFCECTDVTSVVIPNTVTYIEDGLEGDWGFSGSGAFQYCTGLKSISIPGSVNSIGDEAFYGCDSLASITIPDGVTRIGDEAFCCCDLTSVTIPNSVTSIGSCVFNDCESLMSVTIGSGVKSIGSHPFDYCSSLTSIDVDSENQNYSSLNGVLFDKQKSTLINYPDGLRGEYVIPNGVTSIGNYAFGCSGLTSVTIPDSVTNIGDFAFHDSILTSVTIPNSVISIGDEAFVFCNRLTSVTIGSGAIGFHAFHECTSLASVTIGDGVTSIGAGAFYMCRSLTNVTMPNSVTSIGGCAFDTCSGLTNVTIGNGVTSIGELAFWRCNSLTSIDVDPANQNYSSLDGVLFDRQKSTLIAYPWGLQGGYVIPNGVTSIGESAFEECGGLTSVTIPGSVTSIGGGAFACTGLTSVTIPNNVIEIGESAFGSCTSLESVVIEDGVERIGNYAFSDCEGLTDIFIPASVVSIEHNGYGGCFNGCNNLTIHGVPGSYAEAYANEHGIPFEAMND